MMRWAGVGVILVAGVAAQGQQAPELARRPAAPVAKAGALPPPPAAMTAPAKLEPAKAPNANTIYQALRQQTVSGASFALKDFTLKRDAGVFTFASGTMTLYGEVDGHTVGAVFLGEGTLHVEPPSAMERRQLKAVMKTEVLDQQFTSAVFAFTDGTGAELLKGSAGSAAASGEAVTVAHDAQTLFRHTLRYDLEARLLEDMSEPKGTGGFFLAAMKGAMFSKRLIYVVDPHGAFAVAPEEVALLTSGDDSFDVTLGFRTEAQRKLARAADNHAFKIPQQTIDATIEKNGRLTATAVTGVTAIQGGVRVLPLQMFPTLRGERGVGSEWRGAGFYPGRQAARCRLCGGAEEAAGSG